MNLKPILIAILALICTNSFAIGKNIIKPDKTIYFTAPAKDWKTQSLHIGNGYMGGSFYGGIDEDSVDIAEKTFWSGGPNVIPNYNYGIIEGAALHIDDIRESIVKGQLKHADNLLIKHFKGDYSAFGSLSNVGRLKLKFEHDAGETSDYIRGLDLDNSLAFVQYKKGNVTFNREYFCSYPDKSLVFNFTASKKGEVNFTVSVDLTHKILSSDIISKNELVIKGLIEASGLEYCVRIKLQHKGGTLSNDGNSLTINDADEAFVIFTVDTEYDSSTKNFKGVNPYKETLKVISKIANDSYSEIKNRHIIDYKSLFDRVSFSLVGDKILEILPTDQRIAQLQKGMTDDSALKALYFNLGRYLLISASRPGTLPSTLQGIWNAASTAPWSGNYQSNINIQEMHWACGPTNLPECQEPYIDWIEGLVEPGRKMAKAYYGTSGWNSNATGNIWKYVAPGTEITWGVFPIGSAWHCHHLWSQYIYTRDLPYLKNTAYPIMKEAAEFYINNLVEYNGSLIFAPSISAEHGVEVKNGVPVKYSTVNGEVTANKIYLYPSYQDIVMIYDLLSNIISASKEMKYDYQYSDKILGIRDRLMKLKIGKYGQVQEWIEDLDNPRDHHRHVAHMYALYPGNMITADNPDLFNAAKKTLNMRGEGLFHDRWSHTGGNSLMIWRVALWAKLFDGDHAIRVFNMMIKESGYGNMMGNQSGNMQTDASMAIPGVFAEMIYQSDGSSINLLPAIPSEWPEGEIKGFVAKGGYKLDVSWEYSQLKNVTLYVPRGMQIPILTLKNKELNVDNQRVVIVQE